MAEMPPINEPNLQWIQSTESLEHSERACANALNEVMDGERTDQLVEADERIQAEQAGHTVAFQNQTRD
ncbi:hypothetical protein AAVH_33173, partial [Aphelenchoides avenae]